VQVEWQSVGCTSEAVEISDVIDAEDVGGCVQLQQERVQRMRQERLQM
jgi:phage protein U